MTAKRKKKPVISGRTAYQLRRRGVPGIVLELIEVIHQEEKLRERRKKLIDELDRAQRAAFKASE